MPDTKPIFEVAAEEIGVKRQPKNPTALMTSGKEFSDRSQDLSFPPGRGNSVPISRGGHPATEIVDVAPLKSHTESDATAVRKTDMKIDEMMTEGRKLMT